MKTIDISTYEKDNNFYDTFEILCTVKSFDLQAIRERYIASRKNKSGKTGSVKRRPVAKGGIAHLQIQNGTITSAEVLAHMKEPRGIATQKDTLGIAAENEVFILHKERAYHLSNPWFSYIHTLDFHPERPNTVLVSSSGLDCIFEYDFTNGQQLYEWFAWENGFNKAFDTHKNEQLLTRDPSMAQSFKEKGINHLLIANPQEDVLPTAQRAAFINSVTYDTAQPSQLLATFFHEGKVYTIDKKSGKARPLIEGLKNPHGGRNFGSGYMATSTGNGFVHIQGKDKSHYDFSNLPDKAKGMEGLEWLQNSMPLKDHTFITIDSNRNQFIICDTQQQKISTIPFDTNWAIQDFVYRQPDSAQINFIKNLNSNN